MSVYLGLYAIAWCCVVINLLCVFINMSPNKKLLDYGVGEQVVDAVPTLLFAIIMAVCIYWIQLLNLPNIIILLIQFALGVMVYLGLCWLFKEESFMYLFQLINERRKKY